MIFRSWNTKNQRISCGLGCSSGFLQFAATLPQTTILENIPEDFFDGDSYSNYLVLFMMVAPVFPFKRTRNLLHSCLFLFFLETVSTDWNRWLRCPSTTSRQSSFCDVSFRCAMPAVSFRPRGLPTRLTSFNLVKGPCSVQLEAMLLCRGFFCPTWINCSVDNQITSPASLPCQVSIQPVQSAVFWKNIQALLSKSFLLGVYATKSRNISKNFGESKLAV